MATIIIMINNYQCHVIRSIISSKGLNSLIGWCDVTCDCCIIINIYYYKYMNK